MASLHPSSGSAKAEDRLYIAYHDARPVLRGPHLVPIHVGRAISAPCLDDIQGDNTGDNISALNAEYCELTAHYWVWKNDLREGAVGLMHYRRLFDLSGRMNPHGHPERYVLDFDPAAYAGDVVDYFATSDTQPSLIVPRPIHLRQSVAEQYRRLHRARDLQILRTAISERRPDFLPDLDRALAGRKLLVGNMFIMARPVFQDYSQLLFDVLPQVRERILVGDPGSASGYQGRYPGFLAERVLTAYAFGKLLPSRFPGLRPSHLGVVNTDPGALARIGAAALVRRWARGQLSAAQALALWQSRWRFGGANGRTKA